MNKNILKKICVRIVPVMLLLIMLLCMLPSTAAAGDTTVFIGFTSDVHDQTNELRTWLTNLKSSAETLNHMAFGGDYTYWGNAATLASTCSSTVKDVYPDTPVVLAKGNHDTSGSYDKGLVYNGSDYAIYALDLNTSSQIISLDLINALDSALASIDSSKPVFVVSHYPLHHYSSRTTINAPVLVERLNEYPNVVFLWGHNHSQGDQAYGTVKKDGDTIQCASGAAPVTIHFTYANLGSIYSGTNGAYGLLVSFNLGTGDTKFSFQYKNLSGTTTSEHEVTVDTVSLAAKPVIEQQPEDVTVNIGEEANLSVSASVSDGGTLSYQWYQNESGTNTGGTEIGTNSETLSVPTDTPGTKYYYCKVTNTKDGDTASVTSEAAKVRVIYGDAAVAFEYAANIVSGKRYVIVNKSDTDAFALTTTPFSTSSIDYLTGSPVNATGNIIMPEDIDESMIWEFTTDGTGYNIKNGGNYLTRKSSGSAGIYLTSTDAGTGYNDWEYDSNTHDLKVYSSGQRKYFYLYQATSGSTAYFANRDTASGTIYLYELVVNNPTPIRNVEITGIDEPLPGGTPDTSADVTTAGVVTPATVVWNPSVSTFEYDTAYTASVTLSAQFAYEFTSDATVTINGEPAVVTLNKDGTLTATYEFDKTAAAPLYTYEYVTDIDSGATYVIVDRGSTGSYALTASAYSNYLRGAAVTATDSSLNATDVTPDMLWVFTTDGSGYNVKNGDYFLTRISGGGGLKIDTAEAGSAYTDWEYVSGSHYFRTKSNTGGSSYNYLYETSSGSDHYFTTSSSNTNHNRIYLYKQTIIPPTPISSIDVTNIDEPVAGAAPDKAAAVSTEGVTVSAVTWQPNATAFEYDTAYTASVRLYAQSGYAFADNATVTINGKAAVVTHNANGSLTAKYTFAATGTGPITTVAVTDIEAPKAGEAPVTSASASEGVTVSEVAWTPNDSTFDYNTPYTVSVVLTVQEGFVFADSVTVTINGQDAEATRNENGTITASYKFEATEKEPINSVAVTDIDAPKAGEKPDDTASVTPDTVTAGIVTWNLEGETFEFNKEYTATVTLTAGDGYVFTSGTTATVNGNTATDVSLNGDGTLTVTYTFPATAIETIDSIAITEIDVPAAEGTPGTTASVSEGAAVSDIAWDPDDSTFGYDTEYTLSVTLTAEPGYAFAENVTATINGKTAQVARNDDGTVTVSYKFDAITKVMFDTQGGNEMAAVVLLSGTTIEEPATPVRNYYSFYGWYLNPTYTLPVSFPYTVTSCMTFYARWQPVTYTIAYNLDGGTADNPGSYTIETPSFTLENPVKTGYEFAGWTGIGLSEPTMSVTINKGSFGNKAFIANWTPILYDITYDLKGGTASNPESYTIESESFTLATPVKAGYNFAGWTGTGLSGLTKNVTINKGSVGSKSFTANWTPINYSITYDLKGGAANNPASYTIESPAFTLNNPTKHGYEFAGWTGTGILSPSKNVTIPAKSTGNKSFSANWTPVQYAISYDLAGGSASNPASYTIESPTFALAHPTRHGYIFTGWTGTGLSGLTKDVTIYKGSYGAMSFYANWTPVQYAISYDLGGGMAVNPSSYTIETPSFTLNNPTRYGYNFAGWTGTGLSGPSASVTIPKGSSGLRSYSANWSAQPQSNLLERVGISSGQLAFVKAKTKYKITIGEHETSFTLTPIKEYDGATMTINKRQVSSLTLPVANGKSVKFTVVVKLGKKSKTYSFTVTRAKSSNNALGSLSSTAGVWSQPFDPNVLNYTLTLDESTKSTTLKAVADAGKLARVSPSSKRISLNNGTFKDVKFTVRAQSGAKRIYTVRIVRAPSSNANLKSLRASGLAPKFSPGVTDYTIVLPANKSSVTISARPAGYKASVTIDGLKKSSRRITLANGQRAVVRVAVRSQSGAVKIYSITLTRQ
jgi:uncharacterized repeat protein (TIGR02543 family)